MQKSSTMEKKLSVKTMCAIGMLIAITAVLSYLSGFMRIGTFGKFSISFVSVFLSGALFGPIVGGFVGASADVISYFVNPVGGALLWQLTICEFVYGFIYGLFFYNMNIKNNAEYWSKIVICSLVQLAVNLVIKTMILQSVGLMPESFAVSVSMRAPLSVITFVAQLVVFGMLCKYIPDISKAVKK